MIRFLFGTLTILLVATTKLKAASLIHEFELWNPTNNTIASASCIGRCGQGLTPSATCQCNAACSNFNDCCLDHRTVCITATDQALRSLSEELLTLDANHAFNFVQTSIQGRGTACNPDVAPNRLLTVNQSAFRLPTISRLLPLLDNYIPNVNIAEVVNAARLREENEFIDAVFATPVMQRAQAFLRQNGLPNGRADFVQRWFNLFSRGTGALGSSGFEHVFLAETRDNSVMGGHGWIWFHEQEGLGLLDYRANRQFVPDIGRRGSILSSVFTWRNMCKPISSLFIGTSPELELALFTVCFQARRNARCPISLGGIRLHIQTFDITRSGQSFVATAYPDLS